LGKIVIGYQDRYRTATVSATSETSGLPAAYLKTPQPSQPWRTQPGVTSASVTLDIGGAFEVGALVAVATNLTAAATMRWMISSSDPIVATGNLLDTGTFNPGVDVRYRMAIKFLDPGVNGRYHKVTFTDASLPYLEIGRLAGLILWRPKHNFESGLEYADQDWSQVYQGSSGEDYVLRGPYQRGFSFSLPVAIASEMALHARAVPERSGRWQDVLVCINDTSTNLGRDSVYGLMKSLPIWSMAHFDRNSASFQVMERM
jgi:hypothetical protein